MSRVAPLVIGAGVGAATAALVVADRRVHRRFTEDGRRLIHVEPGAGREVAPAELDAVPEPLARYLRWTGALANCHIRAVYVRHGGQFRPGGGRPWMPIRGEYYLRTDPPAFIWYGRIRLAPGLSVVAIDRYEGGRGRMHVRALSAITLADASSSETSQSAFARCVAELAMLAPTFLLDRQRVHAEALGANHVRCVVRDADLTATADLFIGPGGALERIVVPRYFDRGARRATLESFVGAAREPRTFERWTLASHLDGTWDLADGPLHYVSFDVEGVTVR